MNAHPLPPARRPLAAPTRRDRARPWLAAGLSALLLAALTAIATPAAAEPPARAGAQSAQSNPAKAKAAAETAKPKPKTAQAAKRQPRKTSVGQAANPLPVGAMSMAPGAAQAESSARAVAFESGPGVLGVSLRTARQQQIKEYVTEPVALVALAFDDLRFAPVNKGDHVEVNLANRIQFDGKADKVAPKSRRVADVIARILTDNPDTRLRVLVHVDDAGDAAANLRQSQKAADALRLYLISKGLQSERVTAVGRGAEAPLSNKRADRFRNKRVELQVEPLTPPAPQPTAQTGPAPLPRVGALTLPPSQAPGGPTAPTPTAPAAGATDATSSTAATSAPVATQPTGANP